MKAAKRSRVRARLCLFNRSHGQNLSLTSGEAEPFAHYFFKTRPLQSHYRITPQYRCHVKMLLVRRKLSLIHWPSPEMPIRVTEGRARVLSPCAIFEK
jgi:hypothetical protein